MIIRKSHDFQNDLEMFLILRDRQSSSPIGIDEK